MKAYKKEFIEFMIECGVLTFGDFVTKSGRKTPFFVNTGNYQTGSQLARLGEFYAEAIKENFGDNYDILFGPAYKGIPLGVTTAIALSNNYDIEVKVEEAETTDEVKNAIKNLLPSQQDLIEKVFYKNMKLVDIAAQEGVTEAAIRNRLNKIYKKLKKVLD